MRSGDNQLSQSTANTGQKFSRTDDFTTREGIQNQQVIITRDEVGRFSSNRQFEEFVVFWISTNLQLFQNLNHFSHSKNPLDRLHTYRFADVPVKLLPPENTFQLSQGLQGCD